MRKIRRAVDHMLHHGATEVVLLILIACSVAFTVAEVMVPPGVQWWLMTVNDVITVLFVVELSLRFWVAPRKTRFFERYWIDILAVLPLVRPLRLFRVLRVLRLFRAGVLFRRRIGGKLTLGRGDVLALVIGTIALMLISAMVLLAVEGPANQGLDSVDEVLWFSVFSLVGGEPIGGEPVSYVGRWTTLILMLGGLTIFGVFVGTVSASMVHRLRGQLDMHELDLDELTDHVVVCGWNHSVRTVLGELFGPGTPPGRCVVLVTEVPIPEADIPTENVRPDRLYRHIGDYTRNRVLQEVQISHAQSVILMADSLVQRSDQDCDARTVLAALTVEKLAPGIYTVAELHSRQSEELLRGFGVEDVVVADFYSGMILGSVQRNRGLVSVLDDILTQSHGNAFHTRTLSDGWEGRTVAELAQELVLNHRAVLVSVEADGRPLVNPPPDVRLSAEQRVVVISSGGDDHRLL